ncbi:hypothetical protein E2C01_062248 [Portunus trituberculatus]|uniref:Uncharacterized protein n=1 Tax=Portunus trituberculatus TaxID=210409 RepID=A0A5B7HGK0_PORTR|nr:hypothetical protein [Portunus trituberculatus]
MTTLTTTTTANLSSHLPALHTPVQSSTVNFTRIVTFILSYTTHGQLPLPRKVLTPVSPHSGNTKLVHDSLAI